MVEAALKRIPVDFVLPLEQIAAVADAARRRPWRRARDASRSVKCLLVDDLEENLLALTALLRRDDVEVLKAQLRAPRRSSCCSRTTWRWR